MTTTLITTAPLAPVDRAGWEVLARGYHEFYGESFAEDAYARTWTRLMRGNEIHGLGAYDDGQLVGITHYLFHRHVWQGTVCYLQDLYVDERRRGQGTGRALIEHVARMAADGGAFRLYWTTQEGNTVARALYDRVAKFRGFIRYDHPL